MAVDQSAHFLDPCRGRLLLLPTGRASLSVSADFATRCSRLGSSGARKAAMNAEVTRAPAIGRKSLMDDRLELQKEDFQSAAEGETGEHRFSTQIQIGASISSGVVN
jgi:hypothetical protein